MTASSGEHERTLVFAEIALEQIRALRLPAMPRNFAVWYHYATGHNAELNRCINDLLAQKSSLDDGDLVQIYDRYVSPTRMGDQIDNVGSRMASEIKQLLAMIDHASGSAGRYSASLVDASEQLRGGLNGETISLPMLIERLLAGAQEMESINRKLETRLSTSRAEIAQLQQNLETMRCESLTDPLTKLANRKFFDAELRKAMTEARSSGAPLTLLMCDVDHFKVFNDKFGHPTGDQVLRLVAQSIKQSVKDQDVAARYGGEEFAIALPNIGLRAATDVADAIRCAVMNRELVRRSSGDRLGHVTISIGAALLRLADTPQTLIERADQCLYVAKRGGRNCVVSEDAATAPGGLAPVEAKVA